MSLKNALSFYDPTVKTVQGANSTTFRNPGLNTNLTIPELFAFHAERSPEHPVFVYADDEGKEQTICFPAVYRAIRKAATLASAHHARQAEQTPVVGILATAGTFPRSSSPACARANHLPPP